MLTLILIGAASALSTLAIVLAVLLLRRDAYAVPVPVPPAAPAAADALVADLRPEATRSPPGAAAAPEEAFLEALRPSAAPRPVSLPEPRLTTAERATTAVKPEPHAGDDLAQLLDRTLRAARSVPDADAALVLVTGHGEPVIGTSGVESREADRLATSLPAVTGRTRLLAITFDYSSEPRGVGTRRLESGIAVPLTGGATGLVAVFTRSPERTFGDRHVELLESVVERASPAFAALAQTRPVPPTDVEVVQFDELRAGAT